MILVIECFIVLQLEIDEKKVSYWYVQININMEMN